MQELAWRTQSQASQDITYVFKSFMSALNKVVVRQENLKKFHVMKQIGSGGQAKVYQIMSKREEEKAGGSPHPDREGRVFAIKVIIKSQLVNREYFEQMQMINEIRIQRSLRLCGNTIKLFKIYESERYLNLLLEFQEGGTLGDLLENPMRLSEEDARIIIA